MPIPGHRIYAGDVGGYVHVLEPLSHEGEAWVGGDALVELGTVEGKALVSDRAYIFGGKVCDEAWVFGTSKVIGDCVVSGHARVAGSATVAGTACVQGRATVRNAAVVTDSALIDGNAVLENSACVKGSARVSGNAEVHGNALISDHARILGNARVSGEAHVKDHAQVLGAALVLESAVVQGNAVIRGGATVGGSATVRDHALVEDSASVLGSAVVLDYVHIGGDAILRYQLACDRAKVFSTRTDDMFSGYDLVDHAHFWGKRFRSAYNVSGSLPKWVGRMFNIGFVVGVWSFAFSSDHAVLHAPGHVLQDFLQEVGIPLSKGECSDPDKILILPISDLQYVLRS